MDGFKSELRELGWVEGEGIRFELRAAEGQLQPLPKFASEMVSLRVDLIAVIGAVTVRAVRQATPSLYACAAGGDTKVARRDDGGGGARGAAIATGPAVGLRLSHALPACDAGLPGASARSALCGRE